MEIFDVFSMNRIENYPTAGEIILENVILKVSQTHFSKDFYPKGGGGIHFSRGGAMPPPPPCRERYVILHLWKIWQGTVPNDLDSRHPVLRSHSPWYSLQDSGYKEKLHNPVKVNLRPLQNYGTLSLKT